MKLFLHVKPLSRIVLFFCIFIICLLITLMFSSAFSALLPDYKLFNIDSAITLQNILAFAFPAFFCAMLFSELPSAFLNLSNKVSWQAITFVLIISIVAIPALNQLIAWNEGIHLPDGLHSLEDALIKSEKAALSTTNFILLNNNILVSIILVGILTGICEEIFFRGFLQKQLFHYFNNIHIAIWISAFIFSFIHFQFFGFFPRWILGAFFGYMVFWSGSIWSSIFAHALNNTLAIITTVYFSSSNFDFSKVGVSPDGSFNWLALVSLVASIALLIAIPKYIIKAGKPYDSPATISHL